MVSRGVCIGPASNNIVEYTVIINLLSKAISYEIDSLVVYLDSQLVVSQLNNIYTNKQLLSRNLRKILLKVDVILGLRQLVPFKIN